jgi:hypothetical protein
MQRWPANGISQIEPRLESAPPSGVCLLYWDLFNAAHFLLNFASDLLGLSFTLQVMIVADVSRLLFHCACALEFVRRTFDLVCGASFHEMFRGSDGAVHPFALRGLLLGFQNETDGSN